MDSAKLASTYREQHPSQGVESVFFDDGDPTDHGWVRNLSRTNFASLLVEGLREKTQLPKRRHDDDDAVMFVIGGSVFSVVFNEDLDEQVPFKVKTGQSISFKAGQSYVVSTTLRPATVLWVTTSDYWAKVDELEPGIQTVEYAGDEFPTVDGVGPAEGPEPAKLAFDPSDVIVPPAMRRLNAARDQGLSSDNSQNLFRKPKPEAAAAPSAPAKQDGPLQFRPEMPAGASVVRGVNPRPVVIPSD
jgi:hypothetical protein